MGTITLWSKRILWSTLTSTAIFSLLYLTDPEDSDGAIFGSLSIFALSFIALYHRHDEKGVRSFQEHSMFFAFSIFLGVLLGGANFIINYSIALTDERIYGQMIIRWEKFSPLSICITGPIIEEIVYRLVGMNLMATIVALFTANKSRIFSITLISTALIFGIMHIFYGGVDDTVYKIGMAVKSSAAGMLLGWIFWRWGIAYSIICHCLANTVHLLLIPYF